MNDVTMIPIFPLKLVLLPETTLPLHIFEQRYQDMIQRCLNDQIEFGVVYSDGSEIQKVGCTAKIIKVIKKYDDGRMDIMTSGSHRFRLQNLSEEKSYLQASVVYFEDKSEPETPEMVEMVRRGIKLLNEIAKIISYRGEYNELEELNFDVLSFLIANAPGISDYRRQEFLEMTSTSERLIQSVKEVEEVLSNLKIVSQLEKVLKKPEKEHGFFTN